MCLDLTRTHLQPWYFRMFFNAISPFIDKATKAKIEFATGSDVAGLQRDLEGHFDMDMFPE